MRRGWTSWAWGIVACALACGATEEATESDGSSDGSGATDQVTSAADDDDDDGDGDGDDDDDDDDDDDGGSSGQVGGTESDGGETSTGAGDSGEPGDPCANADIICDDFEAADVGAQWSFVGNPANMPSVDASRSHGGGQSLTFAATDTQGAFVYPASGLPTGDNVVYVRAYVSFATNMTDMGGHVSYIVGADQPSNGTELRLGASQNFGNGEMMVDINLLGSGPEYTKFSNGDVTGGAPSGGDGITLTADNWYCMEALFDGANHEFRSWIDGEELAAMHVTDWQQGVMNWSPSYAHMKIGGQNYSGSLGQIWFDDVAMGTQRIGCIE